MSQGALKETEYFMPQGRLMMAERDSTTGNPLGFTHLGNAVNIKAALTTNTIDKKEAMTGQFGLLAQFETERGCTFSFDLESFSKENLAIGLRANVTDITGGTATDVAIKVYKGKEINLPHIRCSSVTLKSVNGTTTYDSGTDYIAYDNSIAIPATGDIATLDTGAGVDLHVSYTYATQSRIDVFTAAKKNYWFWLDALDVAQESEIIGIHFFKVTPSVLKELLLISDQPGTMSIEGACMLDSTRTSGSKYMQIIK